MGLLGAPSSLRGHTRPFQGTAPRDHPKGPPLLSHLDATHAGSVGGWTEFGRAQRGAPNPPSPDESRVSPREQAGRAVRSPRKPMLARCPSARHRGAWGRRREPLCPRKLPGPSPGLLAALFPQALPPLQAPPSPWHDLALQLKDECWGVGGVWGRLEAKPGSARLVQRPVNRGKRWTAARMRRDA